jgi:hypothetical protein
MQRLKLERLDRPYDDTDYGAICLAYDVCWDDALKALHPGQVYIITDIDTDDQWRAVKWGGRSVVTPFRYGERRTADTVDAWLRTQQRTA